MHRFSELREEPEFLQSFRNDYDLESSLYEQQRLYRSFDHAFHEGTARFSKGTSTAHLTRHRTK